MPPNTDLNVNDTLYILLPSFVTTTIDLNEQ